VKNHYWSTVKVDRNGLQFFFKHVRNKEWTWVDIVKPPQKSVLPNILKLWEAECLINGTRELRYQTFILTAYSMGLRLAEALNLRVRQGKGRKNRFVTLPAALLFPTGKIPELRHSATVPMDRGGLQKSMRVIVRDCGIHKLITVRSLRHSYGAHLVEAGINLRTIEHEMGHECPKTTALYMQLTDVTQRDVDQRINGLVNRLKLSLDGEV
jgi:integrase/recombinase XerD